MAFLARFLTALPLLIFSPLVMAISACALALADLLWRIGGADPPVGAGPPGPALRRDAAIGRAVVDDKNLMGGVTCHGRFDEREVAREKIAAVPVGNYDGTSFSLCGCPTF